ncbi:hypothetical protein Tco_1463476 [Tanacetum coccineum]
MSTSTHPIIILSDSDVEDVFSSIDYTPASPDYSLASPRNTSSNSKTESGPSKDLSEDHSAPLAITPFLDDPYIKAQLLQPYEPEPLMQPFRYHPNGITFIHIAQKRVRAPQAHIASPPVLPSPPVVPSSPLSHPRDSVPKEIMPPWK